MDKPIAKKSVYYRYRWHIAGGIAFIVLLVYVGIRPPLVAGNFVPMQKT